ncbi:hypothetical protein [Haliangium ochraceum]|uniref:Uncharacterized protein n=1 Tax=Haliangium ochraceum (strain DSM 14365 / JCM 11303 / SMP-2) TaxID=502025 RepID=D0LQL1_HALO1|nr:hypothetical protein [Haliangium ochraceum]ACY13571.1 hypothetical protein Hoch_0968 [Haliangium ochraceum DSM 14365]
MSDDLKSGNPVGRPKKSDGPRVHYEELDRLLVFGEAVPCTERAGTTIVFPSYRELARRFGVSHGLVSKYAQRHNCLRRREIAQARIAAKTDDKLIELRSNAVAVSKDDELRIIDSYLSEFEKALKEGRVRCDSAGDFNTMLRLKQFIQGGADSRQELHAALSLEDLQARHRRMLKELDAGSAQTDDQDEPDDADDPPAALLEAPSEEGSVYPMDTFGNGCKPDTGIGAEVSTRGAATGEKWAHGAARVLSEGMDEGDAPVDVSTVEPAFGSWERGRASDREPDPARGWRSGDFGQADEFDDAADADAGGEGDA